MRLLAGAGPAAAHARLTGTDPVDGAVLQQAPETVTLTFNEPVRLTDREITVYDAEGREVASEAGSSGTEVSVDLPDAGRRAAWHLRRRLVRALRPTGTRSRAR